MKQETRDLKRKLQKKQSFAMVDKRKNLTVRMQEFCKRITSIGAESYSNALVSAKLCKYGSPENSAGKLMRNPKIRARIRELIEKNMERNNITCDKVLSDLEHSRCAALAKGDVASSIAASRLQGLHLTMFAEKMQVDFADSRQLESDHREAARRIAARLLQEGILDAEFETPAQLNAAKDRPLPVDHSATMAEQLTGAVGAEQPGVINYKPDKPKEAEPEALEPERQPEPKPRKSRWVQTAEERQAELDAEPAQNSVTATVRNEQERQRHYDQQNTCDSD